jgi:hypothetical protein
MSLQLAAASYIYVHYALKKKRKKRRWWRVALHVQTCSGRNRIVPLMRRPNTDSTSNKPVALPTFDTLHGHKSRPHCHDTVLRHAVTLQVCTHLYEVLSFSYAEYLTFKPKILTNFHRT